MFFRNLKFFILSAFVLPTVLSAMPDKDVEITCCVPRQKGHALFRTVVQNTVPGKVVPDDYRITLGIVKDVKHDDFVLLRNLLESVSQIHLRDATFTATSAERYLVNRAPDQSPIVLKAKPAETAKFKTLNTALHNILQGYNAHQGKHYVFHPDVRPENYTPHILLVDSRHIRDRALDRGAIINQMNARLNGQALELLQGRTAPQLRRHGHRARWVAPRRHRVRYVAPRHRVRYVAPRHRVRYVAPRHRVRYVAPRHRVRYVAPRHRVRYVAPRHKRR